jgi:hypothetical protein
MALFSGRSSRLAGMYGQQQAIDAEGRVADLLGTAQTNALGAIQQGQAPSLAALGSGYDAARGEYNGAIDRFNPWVDAGKGALGAYQGSLGLGGAAERDAAVSQFQNSPGFGYAVDQATDAVARKASALGALGSGNTMQAIGDRAQNMQNQEYGAWQDRLNGLSNTGLAATGQQANLQQGLGNLSAQQGRDEAGIYTGNANKSADIYGNFAGLGASNISNMTQFGTNALLNGVKSGQDNVNSGFSFGANLAGAGLGLLGMGMGGGNTLGGNLLKFAGGR